METNGTLEFRVKVKCERSHGLNQELTAVEITEENEVERIISHLGEDTIWNSFENRYAANLKLKSGSKRFKCELPCIKQYSQIREKNDLFLSLRSLLIFGRFIGVIPWRGLFQKDVRKLHFKKLGFLTIKSVFISLLLVANLVVSLIDLYHANPRNAVDYAWTPASTMFSIIGIFVFAFYYKNSEKFIKILKQWKWMELNFSKVDKNLKLHVNLIAGLILTSAILENLTGELRIFLPFVLPLKYGGRSDAQEINALKLFYKEAHRNWYNFVPYNPVLHLLLFLWNKLVLYAWNFMDITLAVFARAIYFKFKALYEEAEKEVIGGSSYYDPEKWRQLTKDHDTISIFLDDIVKFFSPLVFVSYAANVYFIVLHVHMGLTPQGNESTVAVIYAKWAFLHLIARLITVTFVSAKIHEWAHKFIELFRKCPEHAYIMELERTERYLRMSTMGFTGLGCFRITKPLILEIVGVVFTFEIVLLQASQAAHSSNQ